MTTAERIRSVALGPAPSLHAPWLSDWFKDADHDLFVVALMKLGNSADFIDCEDENLQRMALLFVAEAIE